MFTRVSDHQLFFTNLKLIFAAARNNPVQLRPRDDIKIEASQERIALGDTVDLQCKSSTPGAAITWSKVDDDLANNIQVQAGFLR